MTSHRHTWLCGDARTHLNDPNSVIPGAIVPAPRVFENRPLYVVYHNPVEARVEFARGKDVDSGAHAGEVQFTKLLDPNEAPLVVGFNLPRDVLGFVVPRYHIEFGTRGPGFDLSPDPTDAERLYFVYHDTATPPFYCPEPNIPCELVDTDVNIYLRGLTRVQGAKWSVGERILVADDENPLVETDQFLPAIDIDANGNIHIVFYDDRNYSQDDTETEPRFDVGYAYSDSDDQGETWTYRELCDDPENDCENTEPAVDFADSADGFTIRDYIGIEVGEDRVWTCFMGTSDEQDANPNESLIWSTQVLLP